LILNSAFVNHFTWSTSIYSHAAYNFCRTSRFKILEIEVYALHVMAPGVLLLHFSILMVIHLGNLLLLSYVVFLDLRFAITTCEAEAYVEHIHELKKSYEK